MSPGDLGSSPGRVIPKTQKWYLRPPFLTLSIIRYGSKIKWVNPGKGVKPSLYLGANIYPSPPHGQDMTEGQFLGGV